MRTRALVSFSLVALALLAGMLMACWFDSDPTDPCTSVGAPGATALTATGAPGATARAESPTDPPSAKRAFSRCTNDVPKPKPTPTQPAESN
jgi:hypothetical protein